MLKNRGRIFIFLLLIFSCWNPVSAMADSYSGSDLQSIIGQTPFYDPGATCNGPAPANIESSDSLSSGGNLYILGDSITERSSSAYQAAFKSLNITANIDASSSRSLNGAGKDGNKLTGMQAIANDPGYIKTAGAIVVALGTNGGDTTGSIDQAIAAIRADNPSAPIYWVDTITVDRTASSWAAWDQEEVKPNNQAIYSQSSVDNYQVISWFKAVDPNGDPQNPNGAETDANHYIDTSDGLGVHPTQAGINGLVGLVQSTVSGGTGQAASSGATNSCACTSASSAGASLIGNDNIQKAYNYFVGQSLSPAQAAGVVGNLMQESGVDPTEKQGGGDSNDPNSSGSNGWGIAQWTPGSKIIGIAQSLNITGAIYELSTQLQIVWGEMNGTSPTGAADMTAGLKGQTTASGAADYFEQNFEAAKNGGNLPNREKFANEVLTSYGGGSVTTTTTASATTASGCSSTGNTAASCGNSSTTTSVTTDATSATTGTQNNAAIACDVLQYDSLSYSQAWHSNGTTFHNRCPVVGPSCATDCSGLVSIAIDDVYGNDGSWTTESMVTDKGNYEEIPFSQVQPGDFIEPDPGHVEIIESVQGKTISTFGADTSHAPQPDQVGPGKYTDSSNYVYLRYIGKGSAFNA